MSSLPCPRRFQLDPHALFSEQYGSVGDSFFSLWKLAVAAEEERYDAMAAARPNTTMIFFFLFTFIIILIFFSVFIAILTSSYEEVKHKELDSIQRMMRLPISTYLRGILLRRRADLRGHNGREAKVRVVLMIVTGVLFSAVWLGLTAAVLLYNQDGSQRSSGTTFAIVTAAGIVSGFVCSILDIVLLGCDRYLHKKAYRNDESASPILKFEKVLRKADKFVQQTKGYRLQEFFDAVISDHSESTNGEDYDGTGHTIASETSLAVATGNERLAREIINRYMDCSDDTIFHEPVMELRATSSKDSNNPLAIAKRRAAPFFSAKCSIDGLCHNKDRILTFDGDVIMVSSILLRCRPFSCPKIVVIAFHPALTLLFIRCLLPRAFFRPRPTPYSASFPHSRFRCSTRLACPC